MERISQIRRNIFSYDNDDEADNERTTKAEFEGLLHTLNEIADQDAIIDPIFKKLLITLNKKSKG